MRLTIGKKLGFGFGAMLVLAAGLGTLSITQGKITKEALTDLRTNYEGLQDAQDLKASIMGARLAMNRFLVDSTEARESGLREALAEMTKTFDTVKSSLRLDGLEDALRTIDEKKAQYATAAETLIAAMKTKQTTFYDVCGPRGRQVQADLEKLALAASQAGDMTLALKANEALAQTNLVRLGVARFLVTSDQNEFEAGVRAGERVRSLLAAMQPTKPDSNLTGLIKAATTSFEKYAEVGGQVRELYAKIDETRSTKVDPAGVELSKSITMLDDAFSKEAAQIQDEKQAATSAAIQRSIVASILAVVVGIAAAFLISRSITRPINLLINRLKDIAQGEGDLTQRVDEDRKDELGTLGKWFNQFVVRIQDLIKQVADSTRQVAAASTQIAASSEEMAVGLKNQEEQATQVSAAVEEMSASVTEVAKKGADAAKAAHEAGNDAAQGGSVVQGTVVEMKAISEQVEESAQAVADLGKKSEAIGQIIGVINDIADQTNLLALNAAIEAARAGEHGRGFAVVADEVRKLAERTTQATDEVARSIREIQGETTKAVERINAGTERVAKGVELAGNAGTALERIVAGSQSVQSMVHAIAAAAEEQSAASEQIARSVESISAVTRESNQAASQSAQAAAELSSQAEKLNALVGRFKV